MAKTIKVQAVKKDNKVLLWEPKQPLHPGGEAFIANDDMVYEVGESPKIVQLLAEGKLTLAGKPVAAAGATEPPKKSRE